MTEKLSEVYKNYFPIGAAVNSRVIKSHLELLKKHFNSITAENCMKFSETHPEEDKYTFDQADILIDFAVKNDMKVRGHTLVWHNQTPKWVFEKNDQPVSTDILIGRMRDHISTVVGKYRGKVYCWDVVNEAIADASQDYLRKSEWLQIIGEGFIDEAFICAHQADPSAKLFYNDYNECDPNKREKIYRLVKELKERGVPIHGLGLQGHWSIFQPTLDDIRRSIDKYASLGVEIQITEMDISLFDINNKDTAINTPLESDLIRQAEIYGKAFEIFREYKEVISGVTFWGVADDKTWLDHFPVRNRKNWPLIFDVNHNEKKSFGEIVRF